MRKYVNFKLEWMKNYDKKKKTYFKPFFFTIYILLI